jgi:hypothetical protein
LVNREAQTPKTKQRAHPGKTGKDEETLTVSATIRWARVFPVDFEGEDTSLTQAQLDLLK